MPAEHSRTLMLYLLIAMGGALGSVARHWLSTSIPSEAFPWGTFWVNVSGSFIIGLLGALVAGQVAGATAQAFFMVGVCGGFTTFSSFSLQTFHLFRDGQPVRALLYIAGSVILCLVATGLGYFLGHTLKPAP